VLALLAATLAGLILALLLLTGLLPAALLLAGLLARLVALLLLVRALVWILVLGHILLLSNGWKFFEAPRPNTPITAWRIVSFPRAVSAIPRGTASADLSSLCHGNEQKGATVMGRYLLLWLLGIPLPILFLIWIFGGLH
jgi:hypothetical protein